MGGDCAVRWIYTHRLGWRAGWISFLIPLLLLLLFFGWGSKGTGKMVDCEAWWEERGEWEERGVSNRGEVLKGEAHHRIGVGTEEGSGCRRGSC